MKSKNSNVETITLNKVPELQRKSWVDVAIIQAGVFISIPSLLLGGVLVSSMPFSKAIISGTLGYVICVFLTALIGMAGVDLGVPTCVLTRSCFGKKGSRIIISTLFAFAMVGWFAIQSGVCGSAFSNFMKDAFKISFPVSISTIIWGIIMLITAIYGIDALKFLNKILIPILIITFAVGCFLAVKTNGTGAFSSVQKSNMSIMQGIAVTTGFLSVGITSASDYTRYQKSRRGVLASSYIGIVPAGLGLLIIGCVLTKLTGESDLSLVLSNAGIPVLGVIVLILATWAANMTNAYSAGIDLVMLFNLKDNKRALVTFISGIVGIIFSIVGITNSLSGFINWLGIIFMPIAGVMISDYWIIRRGRVENWNFIDGFNFSGIISWVVGILGTVFIKSDFNMYFGFIFSIVIYFVLNKIFYIKKN